MDEDEALQRMRENDRRMAEHRALLERQEPGRRVSELTPLESVLQMPPEFNVEATPEEAQARRLARIADDMPRRLYERALRKLPPKIKELALAGAFEQRDAVKTALKWETERKYRVLIMAGSWGCGKSTAVGAAADACARRGARSISWHRPDDFVSARLHSYDDKSPKLGTDFVVIDDLGRERKVDFSEALWSFLDETETRLAATTNMSMDDMADRYEGPLIDRLRECTLYIPVRGGSLRTSSGGFNPQTRD